MLLKDKTPVELRASLMEKDTPISEVWVYRWAP
jgi:glucans biosynthesis protein